MHAGRSSAPPDPRVRRGASRRRRDAARVAGEAQVLGRARHLRGVALCWPRGHPPRFDWGFVPSTLAPDGIRSTRWCSEVSTSPGVLMSCRPIAVLQVEQKAKEGGRASGTTASSSSRLRWSARRSRSRSGCASGWRRSSSLRRSSPTRPPIPRLGGRPGRRCPGPRIRTIADRDTSRAGLARRLATREYPGMSDARIAMLDG